MRVEDNSYVSRINWDAWIREIRDIGKTNGLTNFAFNNYGQIDLDRAHPGGIAQFTSSGTALLSNLVREPLAFSKALVTARRIKAKAVSHQSNYGIHTSYLVGGIASLEQDGFDLSLPILLWPLDLVRKTDDFELTRAGRPFVNPALISAMLNTYSVSIDSGKLLALLEGAGDLLPLTVTEYLSSLLSPEARVEFKSALIVGNFAVEPAIMEADIKLEGNLILRQLAEVSEVAEVPQDGLDEPRLVADADLTQKRIVARAIRGDSFAVETLPGSGYTQTVVNVLTALVHDRKRVLVVTPRRQTLNELAERFANLGLNGLLVRSSSIWLDVVGAIARYEKAPSVDLVEAGVRKEAAEKNLQTYLDYLRARNESLGLSLLDILEALAKLAAVPNPPTTTARIDFETLERFRDRSVAIELLSRAVGAGLFNQGANDSAWFGSKFESSEQVAELVQLAKTLNEETYPALNRKLSDLVARAAFRAPESLTEQGDYLKLFAGVASSLDRFVPEVFERDVTELIEATGPRKFGGKISGSTRRKLKKLAKEYLRSGMSVSDLHTALQEIKQQRDSWSQFSGGLSSPSAISGFSDVVVSYQNVVADLSRIRIHLRADLAENLFESSPDQIADLISSLAHQTEPLQNLTERNQIRAELESAGLSDVYRDFANLHVTGDHLTIQFDQVWWQSAFEALIRMEPVLASFGSTSIAKLEQEFIDADRTHNRLGVDAFNQMQAHHWQETLASNLEQGSAIKEVLKTQSANYRSLYAASQPLANYLLSAVGMSPYEVPTKLPGTLKFDTVLVLDAAGSNIGDNISALLRASQVIAFGDNAIASPTGFELEANEIPTTLDDDSESVFNKVARIYGIESMRKSWRPTGQTLGSLINREFYQDRIIFEPTATEYSGKSNFDLQVVRGKAVTPSDLKAESPDVEVHETVQAILRHVVRTPEDSLMVVTASDIHAERISGELNTKIVEHAEIKQFFDSHGDEKFEITTLNRLSHRVADRVIFAPGFGVLTTGHASNELGQLSEPSGRRTLANMLVSARKSLSLITAISADTLPTEPVGAAKQFVKIFKSTAIVPVPEAVTETDPMLSDLALRLRKLGAHVTLGYTPRIPMAVAFGSVSAVIVPDWNLVGDDLSEKVRLRPALLEAMGWKTIRVHALEVFADPQTLAIRIGDELGMKVSIREQRLFDEPSFEETDQAWGESSDSNDQRLKNDKPPHWG